MNREEFLIKFRHACWVCGQIMIGQEYNEEPNEHQKESIRNHIRELAKNPDMTPKDCHNDWMKFKFETGWKYGPKKDFEKKEHPDLVTYDELPDVEKRKDEKSLMAHKLGVKLCDEMIEALAPINDNYKFQQCGDCEHFNKIPDGSSKGKCILPASLDPPQEVITVDHGYVGAEFCRYYRLKEETKG